MSTNGWSMESTVDEPSQDVKAKPLFKKLRVAPKDLDAQDFRGIYDLMKYSFSKHTKGENSYYKAHCEEGKYYYKLLSHVHLSKVFDEQTLEYKFRLNEKPKHNFFQVECTFEVLVDDKSLFDFKIIYVPKIFVRLLSEQELLKQIQAKRTGIEMDKYLSHTPSLQDDTITKARIAHKKAQDTAEESKPAIEGPYKDLARLKTSQIEGARRRAYSQRTYVSLSHLEGKSSILRESDKQKSLIPIKEEAEKSEDEKEIKELKDKKHHSD